MKKFYNNGLDTDNKPNEHNLKDYVQHRNVRQVDVDKLTLDFYTQKGNIFIDLFKDKVILRFNENIIELNSGMANSLAEFIINANIPKP